MRTFLAILRIGIFLLLSALAFVGWKAFSIWSADTKPVPTESAWSKVDVMVGEDVTLQAQFRLPYHQTPTDVIPSRIPEALVIHKPSLQWTRGKLGVDGFRDWKIQFDAVLLSDASIAGQSIAFPLTSWGKGKGNSGKVTVSLPGLTSAYAEEMPDQPALATAALKVDSPAPELAEMVEIETRWPWWIIAVFASLGIVSPLIHWLIRRLRRPSPPWETAQVELDRLGSANDDLPTLYTRLADILKTYTGSRFGCSAQASCPHEFRRLLDQVEHGSLTDEVRSRLHELLCETDAVRFAHQSASRENFAAALAPVREFVKATTPTSSSRNEPA
ncbi:hypothetical protein [Haloferula sp.]|uniref:hypothetical protein n=1 Tax=Haloferula sp. TaxID=2497595 RepID=UPI003C756C82